MYDTLICNLNSIFRRNPAPKETMVDFVDMISLSSKPLLGSLNGLIRLFAVLVMVLFLKFPIVFGYKFPSTSLSQQLLICQHGPGRH